MNARSEIAVLPATPLVVAPNRQQLSAADIRHRVNVIQEVMRAVMIKDVHYGVISGTDKPTLYKPGSEVLLATFQIAPSIRVEDLSTDDCIRYRVTVTGTHSPSGMVLGEGIGECSSNESKYKWRKAWDDEFNATPENRRRITFGKYKNKQVRTEPDDVANTILKMAKKRAQVDMTLTVTGASDCFEQDIEDLPEGIRETHREEARDECPKNDKVAQAEWRLKQHAEAVARQSESIAHIKERLAAGDTLAAVNEWQAIDERDRAALWLATEKGGKAFTDDERKALSDAKGLLAEQFDRQAEKAAQEQTNG